MSVHPSRVVSSCRRVVMSVHPSRVVSSCRRVVMSVHPPRVVSSVCTPVRMCVHPSVHMSVHPSRVVSSIHRSRVARDAIVVAVGDTLTSLFGGVVIFSFIGSLAHTMQLHVKDVATQGENPLSSPSNIAARINCIARSYLYHGNVPCALIVFNGPQVATNVNIIQQNSLPMNYKWSGAVCMKHQ